MQPPLPPPPQPCLSAPPQAYCWPGPAHLFPTCRVGSVGKRQSLPHLPEEATRNPPQAFQQSAKALMKLMENQENHVMDRAQGFKKNQ